MADVLNRTTNQLIKSAHTPDYPPEDWIENPDLSAVEDVPSKYWNISGDTVSEKNQTEKDAVDAAEAATNKTATEAEIKTNVLSDPLLGLTVDIQVSGLAVTVNIDSVVDDDVTTLVADSTDTKFLKLCYVFDQTSDTLLVLAYEKTTGAYASLNSDQILVRLLGEWSTPANGTALTEV